MGTLLFGRKLKLMLGLGMGLMFTRAVTSIMFVMPLMVNHLRLISVIAANVVQLGKQMNPSVVCVEREKAHYQQADPPQSRARGGFRSALLTSCEHLSALLMDKQRDLDSRSGGECQPALQECRNSMRMSPW